MSTATLPAANSVVAFGSSILEFEGDSGPKKSYFQRDGRNVLLLENVAVFRSGTFRDSVGYQTTWEPSDIESFVSNFNHLKASGILPDVPVRAGHPQFGVSNMSGLIGYVTALRAEKKTTTLSKQEFTFLFADYEILRADAQEAIDSGLWKNRSAEVGTYVDNNEVPYAPTFMGFAYVDLPAVERLNEFSNVNGTGEKLVFSHLVEEIDMSGSTGQVATPPVVAPAQPAAPAPAPAPAPAAPAAPASFSIGGAATTDYAAVQQYISAMEQRIAAFEKAETDRVLAERAAFVKGLAEGDSPKLLAAQVDPTIVFAQSLNAEQFASWKATMDSVAPNPVLSNHGTDPAGATQQAATPEPEDKAFETAKSIVINLAKASVPHEQIKRGASYAQVIAKDPKFQLPAPGVLQ